MGLPRAKWVKLDRNRTLIIRMCSPLYHESPLHFHSLHPYSEESLVYYIPISPIHLVEVSTETGSAPARCCSSENIWKEKSEPTIIIIIGGVRNSYIEGSQPLDNDARRPRD